jgi:tetratricopeptide (TPR) repeat protein
LTPALARDVCLHTNSKAVVQGAIFDAGNHYGIELTAQNCQTGKTLARTKLEAADRNQIVRTLGLAGNLLREKLGESKISLQKFNQPLDAATSSSPEALEAFAQGSRALNEKGPFAAVPFYRRAAELDSNFADAYCYLGTAFRTLYEASFAISNISRAYELSDRVTQRQRFLIHSLYQRYVTGDVEKALQVTMQMAQIYPRLAIARINLSIYLDTLGKFDKAAIQSREALRLEPGSAVAMRYLMEEDIELKHLDEAKAIYEVARASHVEEANLSANRYLVAFLEGDNAAMEEQFEWAMGKRGAEDLLLYQQSDTEAYQGRLGEAREFSQRAVESAAHAGMPETAALWRADAALKEAMIGEPRRALKEVREGLQLSSGAAVVPYFAATLALAGDAAQAQSLAEKLNHERPADTMVQNSWLPIVQAVLELKKNNPTRAIEILQLASPYEMTSTFGCLSPIYVRGLAYLQSGQGQQAVSEFEKLTNHPELVTNCLVGALSHLQLGRAQVMMGDKPAARKSYQDFLTLWKDADPDVPIYRQAKAEYAKLQ